MGRRTWDPGRSEGEGGERAGRSGGGKRQSGPDAVQDYWGFVGRRAPFSPEARDALADICARVVRESGGTVREGVGALREVHKGRAGPHLDPKAAQEELVPYLSAVHAERLMTYVTTGVPVAVRPARGRKKGVVVPPHPSGQEHQAELWQTLWPDSYRGGMLVFRTKEHRDIVSQLEYAPLGRVPKFDHEGREKEKGRMIHDCSYGEDSVNARTQDEAYPAVWLPVFEALVRAILRWKVLYPGVPVLLTKRDVDAAFRRLVINLEGVELFAAELGDYTIVLVVLSFGWAASPRAYSVISDAISAFHNGHRPAETDVNGRQLFVSFTYVDDGMLAEPDIGYRPWASGQVYERGVVVALGEDAVSQSKKEAEGRWSVEATLLGIITNTADETVTLPHTAIAKGRRELQAPQWARGCTTVTLHVFQKLVGRLYRVTAVRRVARPFIQG
eukprot:52521-Eustigmatos_ZCMA.PRE.2